MTEQPISEKIKTMLMAEEEPSQAGIDAMMADPLGPREVYLSLLTLRHTVNMTVEKLLEPTWKRVLELEKKIKDREQEEFWLAYLLQDL